MVLVICQSSIRVYRVTALDAKTTRGFHTATISRILIPETVLGSVCLSENLLISLTCTCATSCGAKMNRSDASGTFGSRAGGRVACRDSDPMASPAYKATSRLVQIARSFGTSTSTAIPPTRYLATASSFAANMSHRKPPRCSPHMPPYHACRRRSR